MWLNTACTYVFWGQLDRLQAFGKSQSSKGEGGGEASVSK